MLSGLISQMFRRSGQSRTFGAYYLGGFYEGGWEDTNEHQLIRRINAKVSEIDLKVVENLMKMVKRKLKSVSNEGVFSDKNIDFCVEINSL